MNSIFSLILGVAVWGIVHSILASIPAKEFFRLVLGTGLIRFYRLGYNVFAAISFLPVLYLMVVLPDQPLYSISSPWKFIMLGGQALSALLLLVGVLQTDALSFIGLGQLFTAKEKPSQLVTKGLYRYVRHPLYTFGLFFLWLTPTMTLNSFTVYIAATIYLIAGAYFEERKLLREFGQAYADYKRVTPMLIPGLIIRGNK